jgi:hypothetical protein
MQAKVYYMKSQDIISTEDFGIQKPEYTHQGPRIREGILNVSEQE